MTAPYVILGFNALNDSLTERHSWVDLLRDTLSSIRVQIIGYGKPSVSTTKRAIGGSGPETSTYHLPGANKLIHSCAAQNSGTIETTLSREDGCLIDLQLTLRHSFAKPILPNDDNEWSLISFLDMALEILGPDNTRILEATPPKIGAQWLLSTIEAFAEFRSIGRHDLNRPPTDYSVIMTCDTPLAVGATMSVLTADPTQGLQAGGGGMLPGYPTPEGAVGLTISYDGDRITARMEPAQVKTIGMDPMTRLRREAQLRATLNSDDEGKPA